MRKKRRHFKRVVCVVMTTIMVLTGLSIPSTAKAATSLNVSGQSVKGYTYTNSNFTVYNSTGSGKQKIGTCYGSCDLITIWGVGNDGWSKITYPAGNSTKTGFCQTSYLFQNPNFSGTKGKVDANVTTYKKSDCSSSYGTSTIGDMVYIVGHSNGNTQIVYPCSGYHKVAWVKGKYVISNGKFVKEGTSTTSSVNSSATLTAAQIKAITFCATYYTNRYPDLKKAFGDDEAQLYNHWINYGIYEGRSASPVFDSVYYLNHSTNADLKKAYGSNNYPAAYSHFITYGWKEGRVSSEYYCGSYYKNKYSDLRNMSYYSLIDHYIRYGINEKRWGSSSGKIPNMSDSSANTSTTTITNTTGFDPIWPCANTYTVTTLYKYSSGTKHSCRFANGIDIAAPKGENVLAVESGTVIRSEYSTTSGFGNWIMIQHSNGKVSLYAHLSSRKVSVGTTVSKGQIIGQVGNTSAKYNIGYHLHFELGNSNTSGAAGDPYQEYYKTKYAGKIVLTQAAKIYNIASSAATVGSLNVLTGSSAVNLTGQNLTIGIESETTSSSVNQELKIDGKTNLATVEKNGKITLTGSASGGDGSYTYSYLIYNKATKTWARLTPSFVKSNTFTWTAGSAGDRVFYIEVKDGAGTVVRSSAIPVSVKEPKLQITGKANESSVEKGTKVTISGAATGGEGTYTYSCLVYNVATKEWYRFGNGTFSDNNSFSWTASSKGARKFYIEVKDSTENVVRSQAINVTVK